MYLPKCINSGLVEIKGSFAARSTADSLLHFDSALDYQDIQSQKVISDTLFFKQTYCPVSSY